MAYGQLEDITRMVSKYAQGLVRTLQVRNSQVFDSESDYHLGYMQALKDVYNLAEEEGRTGKDIN